MLRLRQICLVAHDRDSVVADLQHVFHLGNGFEDLHVANFGLHNTVIPIGDQFIEVVAPITENTTAGRYLTRRHGNGGYMLIFQTDEHDKYRTRVNELGVRIITDATYNGYTCMQLHPADNGGTFLEIDECNPVTEWIPAGANWRQNVDTTLVSAIVQADIGCVDPDVTSSQWARILDLSVSIGRNCGMHKIRPTEFCVRFTPAGQRGEGLDCVEILTSNKAAVLRRAHERQLPTDDDSVTIGGIQFVLRENL